MAGKSNIEWTGHTWNPLAGCSVLTPGCKRCYAMKMAARLEAMGQELYKGLTEPSKAGPVWTGVMRQAPEHVLLAPLKRKVPTVYFVNSMSDLFHENVPDEWIDRVFAVMALCPQHTFQVLTKRAERMRTYVSAARAVPVGMEAMGLTLDAHARDARSTVGAGVILTGDIAHLKVWPLPNVWLGVSTERQQEADDRIRPLLDTPAAVRFISAEPLLGPIDLSRLCILPQKPGSVRAGIHINALQGRYCESGVAYTGDWDVNGPSPPVSERRKLDWVIVGGESGPDARPMHPDWARSLRDQCATAGVPYFFKQHGQFIPESCAARDHQGAHTSQTFGRSFVRQSGETFWNVGKARAGRLLDGVEYNGMPELRA
jgi:protein gp37